jgi:conjugal transfer pilin signal peptidase TrbI
MWRNRSPRTPPADGPAKGWAPWARLWAALALLAAALLAHWGGEALRRYRFALNQTESLPNWAFLADQANRHPKRGELVAFVPPQNPFYPPGMAFGKIVGGVAGDRVTRKGRAFFVNGRYIGAAKARAQDGRAVAPGPVGRIPPGWYFVYAPHRDSFDSRYALMGWIPQARILGVAKAIL